MKQVSQDYQLRLHGYWRSSCTWRVRIALELKRLPYEYIPVHLANAEQHGDAFVARNPLRQVPVLEWRSGGQDNQLTQSLAILRFLEGIAPEPSLEPASAFLAARAWEASELINAGI